jgi:hypothetical protein
MFKVFFLIFQPGAAWERTAAARRGYAFILATYLVPFVLLDSVVEGWSLMKWGKWQSYYQITKSFTQTTVIHFEILQAVLLLAMVFVSALLVWMATESFNGRRSFLEVFSTVAYGYSPLFLASLLNVSPTINPFMPWVLGMGVTIWILYQGIPRGLKPDPTHALGIYFSAVMVMVLISGMVRLLTALYLLGRIDFQHSWLLRQIGPWLGQS